MRDLQLLETVNRGQVHAAGGGMSKMDGWQQNWFCDQRLIEVWGAPHCVPEPQTVALTLALCRCSLLGKEMASGEA